MISESLKFKIFFERFHPSELRKIKGKVKLSLASASPCRALAKYYHFDSIYYSKR